MTLTAPRDRPPTQWTLVSCSCCGRPFMLSSRGVRAMLNGDRSSECERCAYGIQLVVRDEHRLFWLERFTMQEIREMAAACWGAPAAWGVEWRAGFQFTIPGEVDAA